MSSISLSRIDVICKFGSGRAILSGVHFEYDPYLIRHSKLLNPIIGPLIKHNKSRIMLVKHILNMLSIEANEKNKQSCKNNVNSYWCNIKICYILWI